MEIICPILKKVNEYKEIYKQWKLNIKDKEIIVTTCFRRNKRCIVYIPGFDDYFFYHHVAEEYPDIDFISVDLPGFGNNKGQSFDNHLGNMNELCEFISETIKKCCLDFEIIDILGDTQQTFLRVEFSKRFPDWDKVSTAS